MARNHDNFKPRRSRRSGRKKLKLVKLNLAIMKKLALILILGVLVSCSSPIKIVETYTTDSTGKTVKRIEKIYDRTPSNHFVPNASLNVLTSPLWYDPWFYRPYYSPRIIIPSPRVTVPVKPKFGPLPPSPRPHR